MSSGKRRLRRLRHRPRAQHAERGAILSRAGGSACRMIVQRSGGRADEEEYREQVRFLSIISIVLRHGSSNEPLNVPAPPYVGAWPKAASAAGSPRRKIVHRLGRRLKRALAAATSLPRAARASPVALPTCRSAVSRWLGRPCSGVRGLLSGAVEMPERQCVKGREGPRIRGSNAAPARYAIARSAPVHPR